MNIENIEKAKRANFVLKVGDIVVGIKNSNEDFDFRNNKGSIDLRIASSTKNVYMEIKLGVKWLFIFSELVEIYNKFDIEEEYSKKWNIVSEGVPYQIKFSYTIGSGVLIWIKNGRNGEIIELVLFKVNCYELLNKIIAAVMNVKNFKFSIQNINDENRKLSVAKIDKKEGTIITTFNGIGFGKPYLSESDKFQIKYSAIHRIMYGRWLSVHAERINISVDGVITTVDDEYILDTNEKNKSSLIALVLLASLSFKKED